MSNITYTFTSMQSLADHIEVKAKDMRSSMERQPSKAKKGILQERAHECEQIAYLVRNTVITGDEPSTIAFLKSVVQDNLTLEDIKAEAKALLNVIPKQAQGEPVPVPPEPPTAA